MKSDAIPTVGAVIFSYNRPRMLAEAMATVVGFDAIAVYDDGSDDRDAIKAAISAGGNAEINVVWGEPISPEYRMVTPRFGKAVNKIVAGLGTDLVTYLCDDDLWAPGWADNIRRWFAGNPGQIVARAMWMKFVDGQDPYAHSVRSPLDPRGVTAGNFVHSVRGFAERDIKWSETSVTIHDDPFLHAMHKGGVNMYKIPFMKGVLAGYRREHAWNMLQHLDVRGRYKDYVAEQFAKGVLET